MFKFFNAPNPNERVIKPIESEEIPKYSQGLYHKYYWEFEHQHLKYFNSIVTNKQTTNCDQQKLLEYRSRIIKNIFLLDEINAINSSDRYCWPPSRGRIFDAYDAQEKNKQQSKKLADLRTTIEKCVAKSKADTTACEKNWVKEFVVWYNKA